MMEQADELMNAVSVFQLEGENQNKRINSVERRVAHNPMRGTAHNTAAVKSVPRLVEVKSTSSKPVKLVAKSGVGDGDWEEF